MWKKGGEFMKDDQDNYTPIPSGTETVGLYWEDEIGLTNSVSLDGSGETARIKILVNTLKKGNAVVSYKVNNVIYWTWHVWVTDDPTDGSTYHQGFEEDVNGNLITDWKWMDRNLGATNADFTGNNWNKAGGLQYQWGRKDPFPSNYKDGMNFTIRGDVGILSGNIPIKYRGNLYSSNNTGFDTPNGNIRYSINDPINYIIPPVYIYKIGETPNSNDENYFLQGPNPTDWTKVENTTWFSKNKFKVYDPNNHYNNVTWDLWGDTRNGKWTNVNTSDAIVSEESKKYAMKSSFDPCPCGWRAPSFYSSVGSGVNVSPWGNVFNEFKPTTSNATFSGIKIYPGLGFDFKNVSTINLGKIPVNGNYEYYPQAMSLKNGSSVTRDANNLYTNPLVVFQDQNSDGGLHSSTFFSSINPGGLPVTGSRGLVYVSDAGNVPTHTTLGYHLIASNRSGNTYESASVRCIKDPNNTYMPDFDLKDADYILSPASQYTVEQLKSWTKDPNSYVEYTDATLNPANPADKDMIIDIPLRKAYAMYKLYLSTDNSFPIGNVKSTSVEWTTDTSLISSVQIIDGSYDTAKMRITLNTGKTGNAVVAFHLGSSGQWANNNNADPIIWSWHIWVPKTVIQESPEFITESVSNGGIKTDNSGQFINPTNS